MELIRGLHNLKPEHAGCVATIGNFDGVHLGHQELFEQLRRAAGEKNLPSCIVTFDPLPHEFFAGPEKSQARLTYFREKIHAIKLHAPDRILMLRFDAGLAGLEANDFIQQVLVDGLGIKQLIVGDDFRFGKKRQGSFQTLVDAGNAHGFQVTPTETFSIGGARVSSTRVRAHLEAGELELAAELLGRPYSMEGRVVYGRQLGRTLGYPTANILLKRHKTPIHGIFVVQVTDDKNQTFYGMANVGERPTIEGQGETLLEVHLFDFSANIYGAHLKTVFLHKIRKELQFSSLDELTRAIQSDERTARQWIADNIPNP